MSNALGLKCNVYYNTNTWASPTWVAATCVEDFKRNFSWDKATSDSRAGRIKTTVKTMAGLEYSGRLKTRYDDEGFLELYSVLTSDEPIDLLILDGATNIEDSRGYRGWFHIMSGNQDQGLQARLYEEITVEPADPEDVEQIITHATVGAGPGYTITYDDLPIAL